MDVNATIRRLDDLPLIEYRSGKTSPEDEPEKLLTRIYMGIAPPVGRTPGYCCVVGEEYDGDPMQRDRQKIILDDAYALNPEDFPDEICQRCEVTALEYEHPTIYSLQRAAIALKDVYQPEVMIAPPGEPIFLKTLISAEGLCYYDEEQEHHYQDWFPCLRLQYEVGVLAAKTEDSEQASALIDALFQRGLLMVSPLYQKMQTQWPAISRAVGLVLLEMQNTDITFEVRQRQKEDGYVALDASEQSAYNRQVDEEIAALADALGGHFEQGYVRQD